MEIYILIDSVATKDNWVVVFFLIKKLSLFIILLSEVISSSLQIVSITKGSGEIPQYQIGIQSCFLTMRKWENIFKKARLVKEDH